MSRLFGEALEQRNAAVVAAVKSGRTHLSVAQEFGISVSRVSQAVTAANAAAAGPDARTCPRCKRLRAASLFLTATGNDCAMCEVCRAKDRSRGRTRSMRSDGGQRKYTVRDGRAPFEWRPVWEVLRLPVREFDPVIEGQW